jgi:hypothetical protein
MKKEIVKKKDPLNLIMRPCEAREGLQACRSVSTGRTLLYFFDALFLLNKRVYSLEIRREENNVCCRLVPGVCFYML